jgi:hypothetical protein
VLCRGQTFFQIWVDNAEWNIILLSSATVWASFSNCSMHLKSESRGLKYIPTFRYATKAFLARLVSCVWAGSESACFWTWHHYHYYGINKYYTWHGKQ